VLNVEPTGRTWQAGKGHTLPDAYNGLPVSQRGVSGRISSASFPMIEKLFDVAYRGKIHRGCMPRSPSRRENNMQYDTDKVDDTVLALLTLTVQQEDAFGARARKGHDWDVLNRLHEKGFLGNPISKAKSVVITPEGLAKGRALFEKLFAKTS
jgi:hypothetical protein